MIWKLLEFGDPFTQIKRNMHYNFFLKYSHQTLQKQHSYHIHWFLIAQKPTIHHRHLDAMVSVVSSAV